jgi:Holliday junction resolvase
LEKDTKKKNNGTYYKKKGNTYECKIAKELRELGFPGVKTSRTKSKEADNNKVDIVDTQKKLPVNIQLKKTQSIPSYFKIREESTVDPETF